MTRLSYKNEGGTGYSVVSTKFRLSATSTADAFYKRFHDPDPKHKTKEQKIRELRKAAINNEKKKKKLIEIRKTLTKKKGTHFSNADDHLKLSHKKTGFYEAVFILLDITNPESNMFIILEEIKLNRKFAKFIKKRVKKKYIQCSTIALNTFLVEHGESMLLLFREKL